MRLRELISFFLLQTSSTYGDVGLPSVRSNLMAAFSRKLRCPPQQKTACPLLLQKRTLAPHKSMSAKGPKRTWYLLNDRKGRANTLRVASPSMSGLIDLNAFGPRETNPRGPLLDQGSI